MLEAAHVLRVDMQVVDTMCASIHHTHKELQHCTTTPILIEVKLIWPRKIWVSECAQEAEYLANWLVISHYIRWTGKNWHSKVARFEQVRCIASLVYAPESERIILLTCTGETAISSNSWCEIKKKFLIWIAESWGNMPWSRIEGGIQHRQSERLNCDRGSESHII